MQIPAHKTLQQDPSEFVDNVSHNYDVLCKELRELNTLFKSIKRIISYEVNAKVDEFACKMITDNFGTAEENQDTFELISKYETQVALEIINSTELFGDDERTTSDYRCAVVAHRDAIIERFSFCHFLALDFFRSYLEQDKSVKYDLNNELQILNAFEKNLGIKSDVLQSVRTVIERFDELEDMYNEDGNQMICAEMVEYTHDLFDFLMNLECDSNCAESTDCSECCSN